jgi:pyruvate dehydrogenase phosphatase
MRPSLNSVRDDLTVEVIFFGEGESTGNVTINAEASAPAPVVAGELKAKL